jgi:hypothetical protein
MEKSLRTKVVMAAAFFLVACPKPTPVVEGPDAGTDAGSPLIGTDVCALGDPAADSDCQSGCARSCVAGAATGNTWGACQPRFGGTCAAVHAEAQCMAGGTCGRGPCELGYFDFDPTIPGCETHCVGRKCDLADGGSISLSNDPLHERSEAFGALSSGASLGQLTQRSDAGYQNMGVLGEIAAGTSSSDGGYTNHGGFMSVGRGPASSRH